MGGKEYRVLAARAGGGFAYLTLAGVADRNAAELLRGKEVEALREEAPAPEEGRYYIVDLVGCEVVTETGARLGEIVFPAAEGVIAAVDVENKIITVNEKRFYEVAAEQ